jgi:5-amino-6-(5-phospho-D-ribitylamino)uracil phosphatase
MDDNDPTIRRRMEIAKPIRLLALDLDGTLLSDSKQISQQTLDGLRRLKDVRVVIASARPPRSVRQIYNGLGLDTLQINYNGALIWDEPRKKAVFHRPISGELVRDIIEYARDMYEEVLVVCEILDRSYTDLPDDALTTETGKLFQHDVVAPIEEFSSLDTTKILLLGDPSIIAPLESRLAQRYGDQIIILQMEDHLLQIVHPRAGKAQALAKVAEHYGIETENVMAIGDALNDLGMLQLAGVSIAMSNARPELKKIADWIAPSNNDHGVHAAMVRYGLCPA